MNGMTIGETHRAPCFVPRSDLDHLVGGDNGRIRGVKLGLEFGSREHLALALGVANKTVLRRWLGVPWW
jgi:hypothetical protein